jgi:hypothetical protein
MALTASLFAADSLPAHQTLHGTLQIAEGKPPILVMDGKKVVLEGDDVIAAILKDPRVSGFEVEAKGHFAGNGHFVIDASHNHPMLVRKDGHLKLISYWCDICSIRAYTPGICACCQRETNLDLIDPDTDH